MGYGHWVSMRRPLSRNHVYLSCICICIYVCISSFSGSFKKYYKNIKYNIHGLPLFESVPLSASSVNSWLKTYLRDVVVGSGNVLPKSQGLY